MEAIEFKGQNVKIAEEQEEYQTLPAFIDRENGNITACFKLDESEIKQVKEDGIIYLTIHIGNRDLQPIGVSLLNPFKEKENEL